MDPRKAENHKVALVIRELGTMIRREARAKWEAVRTAEWKGQGLHGWRFRSGPNERYLYVSHEAMDQGENASRLLFEQLTAGRWLDRLQEEPTTALLLSKGGQIEPWSVG